MSSMVMVRAHTLDFVPWPVSPDGQCRGGKKAAATYGGGHASTSDANALHYRTAETGPVTRRAIAADTTAASCAFSQRDSMRAG